MPRWTLSIEDRFWTKADVRGPDECWLWLAGVDRDGYGKFKVGPTTQIAHRWAYEQHYGEIQSGLQVNHLCRVRACVNPSHLEAVTIAENNRRKTLARRTVEDRFWAKVNKTDECWLWTATLSHGYGYFWDGTRKVRAHRWSYETLVGPIPEGLELDHTCREKTCVNPTHLEPVTHHENLLRGESFAAKLARRDRCTHGHEYTPENTVVRQYRDGKRFRECQTCRRERKRKVTS